MGKIKYVNDIRKFFRESPVVDINSLKKFISKKDKKYIYLLISNLLKKKEINRITKGYYTIYDDASLIVVCFKPSYLGLQDAMSFHNLWEQETNPVVLTTNNIRSGLRKVFERNVILKRVPGKYMFGYEYYKYPLENRDIYLPYSDIEKTFIDMVYFRQPLDKENILEFKKKIDKKKLNDYLRKYPKKFRDKVMSRLNN
jgi:predicted transcriptional regulator of viral defense system